MSIAIDNPKGFSHVYRQVWVRRFGLLIQKGRKKSGTRQKRWPAWPEWGLLHGWWPRPAGSQPL